MKAPLNPQKELMPAATYRAVCYSVVDLGTHFNAAFDKNQHIVRIQWEIPDIRIKYEKDGKEKEGPRVVGKDYTFSMHEKATLYQHVNSLTGKASEDFEFETLIGMNGLLNIIHKPNKAGTRMYENISSIISLPMGTQTSTPENPEIFYSIADHGKAIPSTVYKWMVEKIESSNEFKMMNHAGDALNGQPSTNDEYADAAGQEDLDDIPF